MFPDAAGAGEGIGKGMAPKKDRVCICFFGHTVKNRMTVIRAGWGAILHLNIVYAI